MTRKDFEAIAEALAGTKPLSRMYAGDEDSLAFIAHRAQWRTDRDAIADVLWESNERFDRTRFIRATEVDS